MMDELDPVRSPAPTDSPQPTEASAAEPWNLFVRGNKWKKVRWFTARAVALVGSLLLLLAVATGVAAWYTSRPQFCRSCHIMEPYYVSWQESAHKDVSCIKCHFPPGAGEKVRGKLLGLAQLAKYVTGGGGPRPGAAEIPDESCLRSGCHETRLLSGRLTFRGIPFDHRPHLEELRRGKKLRCTSCHSQIVQGSHMTVTTTTCFLCHFKDGHLNEGLGTCTRCHQIPEKDFELGGGVPFNHNLAFERGVDCANCHSDLIRGRGEVPRERCRVCHNRESDLQRINEHEFLHQMHVTEHKVDCLNCHLTIQHSLDKERIAHAASDCAACHPDHHQEQVSMLQGRGARTIPADPGSMAVARIACPSCHRVQQTSATGTVLWKGSLDRCAECHDAAATSRFQAYHLALRACLTELDGGISRARQALAKAALPADRSRAVTAELGDLQHDLTFLHVGNDIHNIHYAAALLRRLVVRVSAICRELKVAEPKVTLPEAIAPGQPGPVEPGPKPAEKPADAEKPKLPDQPADAEKPTESQPPTAAEKPMEGEQPAEAEKPPEPKKPADTPAETEKPGTDTPAPSSEKPSSEKPSSEKPSSEKPPGTESSSADEK
jgi:nitrate/TMAO reductase-like tetraheme cytochrome c subunit